MSKYYNPKRTSNLYDPGSKQPYRLSRTKIADFVECSRCFYLDRRLGTAKPPGYPHTLNTAVDTLLKKEFDIHRAKNTTHPLMKKYGIDAVPLAHEKLDEWRDSMRRGVSYLDKRTNFLITGGIDDVWVDPKGRLIVVDYKATAKEGEVSIDADWQISFKRQMEIYQWLFRKNGFEVSPISYFVYCNGDTDKEAFDAKLEFDVKIIPYRGDDSWVDQAILDAYKCLRSNKLPKSGKDCDYCIYRQAVREIEK